MQIVWEILREDVKKEKEYNILDDLFVWECFILWALLRHKSQIRKCNRIQWLPPKLTVLEILLCRLCWIRTSACEIYFGPDSGSLKSKTILVVVFFLLLLLVWFLFSWFLVWVFFFFIIFIFCFYAPSNSCTSFVKIYQYERIIINSSFNSSFRIPKRWGLQNAKEKSDGIFKANKL